MEVQDIKFGQKITGKKQVYNKLMDAFEYQPCEGTIEGYRSRDGRIEVYFSDNEGMSHWNYIESIKPL